MTKELKELLISIDIEFSKAKTIDEKTSIISKLTMMRITDSTLYEIFILLIKTINQLNEKVETINKITDKVETILK